MSTEIILILFGFLLGIAVLLIIWIVSDKHKRKEWIQQRELQIYNPESFCYQHCKFSDQCYSEVKDPDLAEAHLVNEFCIHCPVGLAQDVIEEAERKVKHENKNA